MKGDEILRVLQTPSVEDGRVQVEVIVLITAGSPNELNRVIKFYSTSCHLSIDSNHKVTKALSHPIGAYGCCPRHCRGCGH